MKRKIIAFIEADEDKLLHLHPEDGVGAAFEKEMEKTEDVGIRVSDWLISDSDDEVPYGRYIDYLFQWAMDNAFEEDGGSPLTYDQWQEQQSV